MLRLFIKNDKVSYKYSKRPYLLKKTLIYYLKNTIYRKNIYEMYSNLAQNQT
jgi:hypothetical protein